jgi:hypothetical protein
MRAAGAAGRVHGAPERVHDPDRLQAKPGAKRIELQRGLAVRHLAIEVDPRDRVPAQRPCLARLERPCRTPCADRRA